MKISKNFSRSEFACKCGCGFDVVDAELITVLERLRTRLNAPITVNSGVRCVEYNKKVGGAKGSQHLLGKAADIVVKDYNPKSVANLLEYDYTSEYGIGRYASFTHIDVRTKKARWG